MANRKPAKEEDFGFVAEEDFGFTPEEEAAAGQKMAKAVTPTMETPDEFGFIPEGMEFESSPGYIDISKIGETAQDVITTMPQGVTTWADEIQAAMETAGGKAMGNEVPWADLYSKNVEDIRRDVGRARERSPYATTAGEFGAGIASSFIPGLKAVTGAGKLSGVGGMALRGAAEGMGAAESADPFEMGLYGLAGSAIGTAGGLASEAAKTITTQNPSRIRASVLGAKTSQFKEIGIKEREQIAKEMKDMGLFQKTKSEFNPKTLKWESKGSSLENIELPVREKLLARIDQAFEVTDNEKEAILAPIRDKAISNPTRLMSKLDDSVNKFAGRRSGMSKREDFARKQLQDILDDMQRDINNTPNKQITVGILEKAKKRLSEDVGSYGKDPILGDVNDIDQLYKNFYSDINDTLRFEVQDKTYNKLNDAQQRFYTVKGDLKRAMAAEPPLNIVQPKTWIGGPESQLSMARAAEIMEAPGLRQLKTPLRMGVAESPFATMRFFDPSMSGVYDREKIMEYRLPLTTQGLLENKEIVLAKLVQENAPIELVAAIKDAMNKDPNKLTNAAMGLYAQMPELFEDSNYKVFNGRFIDPNDRAKAADDISKRDDLNSIERARMINKINKTGEVPEGL